MFTCKMIDQTSKYVGNYGSQAFRWAAVVVGFIREPEPTGYITKGIDVHVDIDDTAIDIKKLITRNWLRRSGRLTSPQLATGKLETQESHWRPSSPTACEPGELTVHVSVQI